MKKKKKKKNNDIVSDILDYINPEVLQSNGTGKDRIPSDINLDEETPSTDDQSKAARMGIPAKTFKKLRDLLLNTTGIYRRIEAKNATGAVSEKNPEEVLNTIQDREERSSYSCPESPPDVVCMNHKDSVE